MSVTELRASPLMSHLLDALEQGKDIGHYGRLTVAMVARHFVDRDELVRLLLQGEGIDTGEARALVQQVEEHDYSPPSRRQVLEWQEKQDFPICPNPQDPDACNVYRDLTFPESVYEDIEEYRQQRFAASDPGETLRHE